MKKRFINIFFCMFLILSATSCGMLNKIFHKNTNNGNTELNLGSIQSMHQINENYTAAQVDSMCITDNLPKNLNNWTSSGFIDFETNNRTVRYMYIKGYDEDKYEMIYLVTPRGGIYLVSKRKVVFE